MVEGSARPIARTVQDVLRDVSGKPATTFAGGLVEVNLVVDSRYRPADNRLA